MTKLGTRGRFALETLAVWAVLCLPINLLTCYMVTVAPDYSHLAQQGNGVEEGPGGNITEAEKVPNGVDVIIETNIDDTERIVIFRNTSVLLNSVIKKHHTAVGDGMMTNESSDDESHLGCYDLIEDSEDVLYRFEFWVSGVVLFACGVLGVIGNILTLIALIFFENKTSFNKLLVYLTFVDLLLIVACVNEFAVLNVFVGAQPYWYRLTFPYFIHPLKNTLLSLCIFLMVAVSSERCQAICHPLRERPSPRCYMAAVALMAVTLNARKFFEFQLNSVGDDFETTSIMEYPTYTVMSSVYHELIVTGVIPFLALVVCNIRIYCKIRESSKHEKHRHVGGGGTISRSNNNGGTISSARTRTPSPSPVAGGEDQEAQGSSCTVSTQVYPSAKLSLLRGLRNRGPTKEAGSNEFELEDRDRHRREGNSVKSPSPPSQRDKRACKRTVSYASETTLGSECNGRAGSYRKVEEECGGGGQCQNANIPPSSSTTSNLAATAATTAAVALSPTFRARDFRARGQQRTIKKRHEKSVIILVLIVVVFLSTHSFRLGLQSYQTFRSDVQTKDHYNYCSRLGRHNLPTVFFMLISFNNLFLVINSSINFIIYCAVRKSFRHNIIRILRCGITFAACSSGSADYAVGARTDTIVGHY